MTELDLYKFICNNHIEWHRRDNDGTPDIIIFLGTSVLKEFVKLVKGYISEEGIESRLIEGYFSFWMKDLCDHYDLDIDKVFCEKDQ